MKDTDYITKKYFEDYFDKKFDQLALMIGRGFKEVYERCASKEDVQNIHFEMTRKEDLGNLENRLSNRYENRIEKVEDDVRIIKTKLQLS